MTPITPVATPVIVVEAETAPREQRQCCRLLRRFHQRRLQERRLMTPMTPVATPVVVVEEETEPMTPMTPVATPVVVVEEETAPMTPMTPVATPVVVVEEETAPREQRQCCRLRRRFHQRRLQKRRLLSHMPTHKWPMAMMRMLFAPIGLPSVAPNGTDKLSHYWRQG